MVFQWTNELDTGIDVIDEQHKRIVEYINKLETTGRNNPALVGRVLDELVDYTLSHFAFEESLIEEAGYAFAKPHKAIHDLFIKRIAKYQERHQAGEDVAAPLHDMLTTWLTHHIRRDDMAYVNAVQSGIHRIVADQQEVGWLKRSIGRFFR